MAMLQRGDVEAPPAKRHKVTSACDTCRKSKTRCEPTPAGCHRCSALKKPCSFAPTHADFGIPTSSHSTSTPSYRHATQDSMPVFVPAYFPPTAAANREPPLDSIAPSPVTEEALTELAEALRTILTANLMGTTNINPLRADLDGIPPQLELHGTPDGDELDSTQRLLLRPLAMIVTLLSKDKKLYTSPPPPRDLRDGKWLCWPDADATPSHDATLESVFGSAPNVNSLHTLQSFATWTVRREPEAMLNQRTLATSAINMARGLSFGVDSTPAIRLHMASLRVTEALLACMDSAALPAGFRTDVASLLFDLDPTSPPVELLSQQVDLLSAVSACFIDQGPVGADAHACIEHYTSRLAELKSAAGSVRMAAFAAPLIWKAYYEGFSVYARFFMLLGYIHATGFAVQEINRNRSSAPNAVVTYRTLAVTAWGTEIGPAVFDVLTHALHFATFHPLHLAQAPDTLYACIIWTAALFVRIDALVQAWYARHPVSRTGQLAVLRALASALLPSITSSSTSGERALASRPLAKRTGVLCRALIRVLETQEPPPPEAPPFNLDDLFGPAFFELFNAGGVPEFGDGTDGGLG